MTLLIAVSPFSSRKWEWSISQGNHKAEIYSVKCCAYLSWSHHPGHYEVLSRRLFTQEVSQQSRAAPKKGPPRPCLSRCGTTSKGREGAERKPSSLCSRSTEVGFEWLLESRICTPGQDL